MTTSVPRRLNILWIMLNSCAIAFFISMVIVWGWNRHFHKIVLCPTPSPAFPLFVKWYSYAPNASKLPTLKHNPQTITMLIKNAIAHEFNIIHNMFNLRGTEVVIWMFRLDLVLLWECSMFFLNFIFQIRFLWLQSVIAALNSTVITFFTNEIRCWICTFHVHYYHLFSMRFRKKGYNGWKSRVFNLQSDNNVYKYYYDIF
jgi:hypothetical protein